MSAFLQGHGFLGGTAPLGADLSLLVMVLAAVLMTIGWRLAVRKNYGAHRWVQTGGVCLNAVLVLAWMIRQFVVLVLPGIPGKLDVSTYDVATVHAVVGAIGFVLGVYVVLSASDVLPKRVRFTTFKPWMRGAYALYLLGTLSGVILYAVTYVGG